MLARCVARCVVVVFCVVGFPNYLVAVPCLLYNSVSGGDSIVSVFWSGYCGVVSSVWAIPPLPSRPHPPLHPTPVFLLHVTDDLSLNCPGMQSEGTWSSSQSSYCVIPMFNINTGHDQVMNYSNTSLKFPMIFRPCPELCTVVQRLIIVHVRLQNNLRALVMFLVACVEPEKWFVCSTANPVKHAKTT